jgi:hypothetical protein
MPVMDGLTMIRDAPQGPPSGRTPIIFLTTESDDAMKAAGQGGRRDRLADQALRPRPARSRSPGRSWPVSGGSRRRLPGRGPGELLEQIEQDLLDLGWIAWTIAIWSMRCSGACTP